MSKPGAIRTAIVTGAGSGIGQATAFELAKGGYMTVLVGRTRETLEETLKLVQRVGQGLVITADVSKMEEVNAMVDTVVKQFGFVDVLVNNAGYVARASIAEFSPEEWHQVLDTNLSAAFYTTRAVWPHMAKRHMSTVYQGRGVIVNISSMASKDPFPGLGAYGVAKAGLNMLSLVTAREGEAVGIRVICIAPGAVDTAMFHAAVGNEPYKMDGLLESRDVAKMVMEALHGSLRYTAGDTVFVHRRVM